MNFFDRLFALDEPSAKRYNKTRNRSPASLGTARKESETPMAEDFGADLVTVADEDGKEHQFELIDAIETDDGRYVALLPIYDDPEETLNDDGELIILEVTEENGDDMLVQIEDEELFEEIAEIFEERLADLFEIEEVEQSDEESELDEK